MSFRLGLSPDHPALVLAPMEGVTDAPMREWMGARGGFTYGVSEFMRVTQNVIPRHVFLLEVPELRVGGYTPSGLPIQVQLLGGDPERMALSAMEAVRCGAWGIDINFGCPAATVNRHDGGAALLRCPTRIRDIVEAVRRAVPASMPVSAKMRLGWDSHDPVHENAEMAAQGGASWITIHGRTKVQGYQPPAYWGPIGEVRRRLGPLPVVANGDLWTREDFLRCRDETRCEHFMIGRSAIADPNLPLVLAGELGIGPRVELAPFSVDRAEWAPVFQRFTELSLGYDNHPKHALNRLKQWVRMVAYRREVPWFGEFKRLETLDEALAFCLAPPREGLSVADLRTPATMYATQA